MFWCEACFIFLWKSFEFFCRMKRLFSFCMNISVTRKGKNTPAAFTFLLYTLIRSYQSNFFLLFGIGCVHTRVCACVCLHWCACMWLGAWLSSLYVHIVCACVSVVVCLLVHVCCVCMCDLGVCLCMCGCMYVFSYGVHFSRTWKETKYFTVLCSL